MRILLTGKPGSGKSRLITAIAEELKNKGKKIRGIITPEIREGGRRCGFRIVDIASGEQRTLASVDEKGEKRVGKYTVNVGNIDYIVEKSNWKDGDIILIDEIGKMELFSQRFKKMVDDVFSSPKPAVAVVHRSLARKYKSKFNCELIVVEKDNLDKIKKGIVNRLEK